METFSALLAICAGNSPVSGDFPAQRPVTRSFDVFFDLRLIKRLSKHSRGWWFETLSRPLWRHCNDESSPFCSYMFPMVLIKYLAPSPLHDIAFYNWFSWKYRLIMGMGSANERWRHNVSRLPLAEPMPRMIPELHITVRPKYAHGFGVFLFCCGYIIRRDGFMRWSWWCRQMEMVSALQTLCEGNPPVTGGFPSERASNAGFDVYYDLSQIKRLNKQSSDGDLRRQVAHCAVNVLYLSFPVFVY